MLKMTRRIVSTKAELEQAKNDRIDEIIVIGKLAEKLKRGKKIALSSAGVIAALAVAIAAMPFTGGVSLLGAAPIAAMTGFEIAAIIAAASVGLTLLVAVFMEYEEIEYDNGKMSLRRKRK